MKSTLIAVLALACATVLTPASADTSRGKGKSFCGSLDNAYGPFDYRRAFTDYVENIRLVESAHFNETVKNGISGISGKLGDDLDYTLRAFPNHHEALTTIANVSLRDKVHTIPGGKRPVECYFERALRFTPDDGAVYATYGNYLYALGQTDRAQQMFIQAVKLLPDNPAVNYNMGLSYFRTKQYDKANQFAQQAYALGFPLPGLKNMLVGVGKWDTSVPVRTPEKREEDDDAEPKAEAKTDGAAPAAKQE